MKQIEMIGSQEVYRRLLEAETEITLDLINEVARPKESSFHCQIMKLTATSIKFDISRHVVFCPVTGPEISFRGWQELHLQACQGAEYWWHGAYLYTVTERTPGINLLTVYQIAPIQPGQPTYVSFSNMIPPTRELFGHVYLYQEPTPAPAYDYLPGTDWIDWITEE